MKFEALTAVSVTTMILW